MLTAALMQMSSCPPHMKHKSTTMLLLVLSKTVLKHKARSMDLANPKQRSSSQLHMRHRKLRRLPRLQLNIVLIGTDFGMLISALLLMNSFLLHKQHK